VAHYHSATAPALLHVTRTLEEVGELLRVPTPTAIRQATLLLEDAIIVLRRAGSCGRDNHSDFSKSVEQLKRTMDRTRQFIDRCSSRSMRRASNVALSRVSNTCVL